MRDHSGELGAIAQRWFEVMRGCGHDVRELLHDGHPTACVGDAAFGYVNSFTAHVNVGFFRGAEISDPVRGHESATGVVRAGSPTPDESALERTVRGRYSRAIKSVVAALYSASAYASFNSFGNGPLCSNFDCVLSIGAFAGLFGVPLSVAILWGLAFISRNRQKPNRTRTWWVVTNGVIAYAITIVVLLLGSSRDVKWVYVYLAYAAVFTMVSAVFDRRR